jgi:pyruvate kinase
MCDTYDSTEVLFYTAKRLAVAELGLQPGDPMVITGGITNGKSPATPISSRSRPWNKE